MEEINGGSGMNKLYLTCTNNKKFEEWAKQNRSKLKKTPAALDHFNQGYNQVAVGNYLARASFVCYWEIYSSNSLARLAPAITQASLIHMMHRFLELDNSEQEIEVVNQMMINFLRLLQKLDSGNADEEE